MRFVFLLLFLAVLFGIMVAHADLNPSGNLTLVQFPASSSAVITAAATTSAKATAGTLRRITVTTEVANATIKLFDLAGASCTGAVSTNPKGVLTLPSSITNPFTIEYQASFVNGICVLTSGATNLIVIYD